MTDLGFKAFDADNHYYESQDAFTRHIDPRMKKRCMNWADLNGRKELLVAGKVNRFIPNATFDPVARPGCLDQYYRGNNPEGLSIRDAFGALEPIRPEYRDRDLRLAKMDEQRIEKAILRHFDLRPAAIIETLDLLRPIYFETARHGHFGRKEFRWEQTDVAERLRKEIDMLKIASPACRATTRRVVKLRPSRMRSTS